ncbi:hypothetical protein [Paragemmobacter ruber]|uniref:Uncharacterized protein n=1 Tax=Paragemmobacter ruber TaxID=1985673 RepID=A0ABW9Y0C8_9RHOB|nr:hypothetical protein [Rhodobacter ruber]NBE05942.1 hypothetical protein [Rhodobacter ruber]
MGMDRLEQIMRSFGGEAMQLHAPEDRAVFRAQAGSQAEAQALAWAALPEAERVALVKAAGAVPEACGDAIPVAPARGAVRVFDFYASYPDGEKGSRLKPAGHLGRRSMERLDVFGRMEAQGRRRGRGFALTASQVGIGRMYRTLVEDRDAGAVRCASGEALMAGGSRGGTREGFTDHRLALSRRIDAMQARVEAGAALVPVRGRGAPIPARALVDAVCLEDRDLSDVLRAHGWAVTGAIVTRAVGALAAALDRMMGIGVELRSLDSDKGLRSVS